MIGTLRRWLAALRPREHHLGCPVCAEWIDLYVSSSRFVEKVRELWDVEHEHLETVW